MSQSLVQDNFAQVADQIVNPTKAAELRNTEALFPSSRPVTLGIKIGCAVGKALENIIEASQHHLVSLL